MVKAVEEKSDTAIDSPSTVDLSQQDARSEAERVLDEIEQAADLATQSLAKDAALNGSVNLQTAIASESTGETDTHAGDGAEKSPEEVARERAAAHEARIAFLVKRAKSQKERGRAQLERVVVGAMAIRKDVEFFDVNIASSAERFLGLIDLSVYTINRRGEYILGERDAAKVMERFASLVNAYRDTAVAERDQAALLLKHEEELTFDTDWIVPEYRETAFKMAVYIKHPSTLKVLEGLFAFDTLVRNLTILQWNGKVDQVRIDQARQQERRALSQIHQFAGSSLIGLNRRARPARAPAHRPARFEAPAEAAEPAEATMAV